MTSVGARRFVLVESYRSDQSKPGDDQQRVLDRAPGHRGGRSLGHQIRAATRRSCERRMQRCSRTGKFGKAADFDSAMRRFEFAAFYHEAVAFRDARDGAITDADWSAIE